MLEYCSRRVEDTEVPDVSAAEIKDQVEPPQAATYNAPEAKTWQRSLDGATPAIIVIRVCAVRPFDGQGANYSYATGFVVDRERGIILTNRHVVTAGPVSIDAIFANKEEVDLMPLYRLVFS